MLFEFPHDFSRRRVEDLCEVDEGRNIDMLNTVLDLPDKGLLAIKQFGNLALGKATGFSPKPQERTDHRMLWSCGAPDGISQEKRELLDSQEE